MLRKHCCDFFPQFALCPICFYLRITNYDLSPCYACFEHVIPIMGVCNMALNMVCALWNIHTMGAYEWKTCLGITQFVFRNMNEAKDRLGGKICSWLHSVSLVDSTFFAYWQIAAFLANCDLHPVAKTSVPKTVCTQNVLLQDIVTLVQASFILIKLSL